MFSLHVLLDNSAGRFNFCAALFCPANATATIEFTVLAPYSSRRPQNRYTRRRRNAHLSEIIHKDTRSNFSKIEYPTVVTAGAG
jgi:hypothetical protein